MILKILSLSFIFIGVFLLVQVIMPVISFKIWEISFYNQNLVLVSPDLPTNNVLGINIEGKDFPAFISNNKRTTPPPYQNFNLSIPSINLKGVSVLVDSNDFEANLAHLPGTSLPGEKGNVFISGHSSLPQIYKKDSFKAIFSNLPQVKKGDQVSVEAGGQEFKYEVISLKIVDPKDISVINPPDSVGRYLTLMTCVPPGLYYKRLVILAKLV